MRGAKHNGDGIKITPELIGRGSKVWRWHLSGFTRDNLQTGKSFV